MKLWKGSFLASVSACLIPNDGAPLGSVSSSVRLCVSPSLPQYLSLSLSLLTFFCIFFSFYTILPQTFLNSLLSCPSLLNHLLSLPRALQSSPPAPLLPAFPLASQGLRPWGTASALSSSLLSTHSLIPATLACSPCVLGQQHGGPELPEAWPG